jgi:outer membrane protein assembly factor BamE
MTRALTLALALLLGACALPDFMAPYRIDIQQGNYITQEMVSQLKPGMTKEQVRYLLGTPLLTDIFHAERWDYVYWFDRRGQPREQRRIAVFFQDGKLARLDGDVAPAGSKKGETQ